VEGSGTGGSGTGIWVSFPFPCPQIQGLLRFHCSVPLPTFPTPITLPGMSTWTFAHSLDVLVAYLLPPLRGCNATFLGQSGPVIRHLLSPWARSSGLPPKSRDSVHPFATTPQIDTNPMPRTGRGSLHVWKPELGPLESHPCTGTFPKWHWAAFSPRL
jgi:hypothetical protein